MRKRAQVRPAVTVATIRDVAELAGVSTATVSRVFSESTVVREDLREKVRSVAKSLNYRPNRLARNLRTRRTQAVGVVIPDIENPFFTSVVCGIEDVLRKADYSLLLANSNEDPVRERSNVEALQAEAIAGMIFTPSGTDLLFYQEMNEAGMPLVAVSRQPASLKVDSVVVANREGSRQAVAYLAQLGHRRIAMISGPASVSTAKERLRGYEQALRAAGIGGSRELVQYADFRQAGGYRAMQNLLALSDRPTAVFAGSNLMTLGALQAIHEAGLRIPDEIAIIGFDDMPWAVSLQPPLTVVAQPAFDVGVAAARLLLERIARPSTVPKQITLDTRLILRASSGGRVKRKAYARG